MPERCQNNRILVIDDNHSIHDDIRKILVPGSNASGVLSEAKALLFDERSAGETEVSFEIDSAYQGQEGLQRVQRACADQRPYAMAFVDVRMPPGWDGVETVTRIWREYPELQVVICTAYSDYSWGEMIRQMGKTDNLVILKKPFDNIEVMQLAHALTKKWSLNQDVKSKLDRLDGLVAERTLELQQANRQLKGEIAGRLQIEKALRLSEERFCKAFKASPIPLAIQSVFQQRFVDANEGFQELTGFSRGELIGHTPAELRFWADVEEGRQLFQRLREEMSVRNVPCRFQTKLQEFRDVLVSLEVFELDGQPFLLMMAQDISERMKLEEQLRQAQKMEAMGQLAAGVAHDFNNILTVIQGYASLLLETGQPAPRERKALETISAASERATKLVRQLLTFSRKQFMQLQALRMRDTFASLSEMLPRLIGENIEVQMTTEEELPVIQADAAMMEQMLINLAVNARDAMPSGGRLTFSARRVEITNPQTSRCPEARPGDFLCLTVSDTGCGIAPEVLPRIFEPFFTTKGVGKGTGLGLATVFGIVKQHQGWIEIDSQPAKGCTFRIFLPLAKKADPQRATHLHAPPLTGGTETILVVEDEEDVRDFVVQVLQAHGYRVFPAGSGAEACDQWARHKAAIDLLLTDLIMPGTLSGRDLAERLLSEKPQLRVVYTSGYSPGMAGKELILLSGHNFLPKPHGPARLLAMVRECLDASPTAPSPVEENSPVDLATASEPSQEEPTPWSVAVL